MMPKIGIGFDIHRTKKPTIKQQLILCGIPIDHDYVLEGHSDADPVLHAITDALLGLTGHGSIGEYFPETIENKNRNSSDFVDYAYKLLLDKKGFITNIDIIIFCEQPKIIPYKVKMINRLAQILNISNDLINIKGKTMEKLGVIGNQEAIAVQVAICAMFP